MTTSFLNVNGYDFPCPRDGFHYTIATMVDSGRDVNARVVGQRLGRDQYKLDTLEWVGLYPAEWQRILQALSPFFCWVTFIDMRTNSPVTIRMYPGDRDARPLFVNPQTHLIEQYHTCKLNLIDTGW